jgi:hypothetical protein
VAQQGATCRELHCPHQYCSNPRPKLGGAGGVGQCAGTLVNQRLRLQPNNSKNSNGWGDAVSSTVRRRCPWQLELTWRPTVQEYTEGARHCKHARGERTAGAGRSTRVQGQGKCPSPPQTRRAWRGAPAPSSTCTARRGKGHATLRIHPPFAVPAGGSARAPPAPARRAPGAHKRASTHVCTRANMRAQTSTHAYTAPPQSNAQGKHHMRAHAHSHIHDLVH